MKILVTGANGFVGRAICAEAVQRNMSVCGAVRTAKELPMYIETYNITSLDDSTDWRLALRSCDVVVHVAARAHVRNDKRIDPERVFWAVNVEGTLNLARQALLAGVKRFVFISSIGVNGAETKLKSFCADDRVAPKSHYALSKFEAELGLRKIANNSNMELVIIRPPLVYGANAPGNFGFLLRWVARGLPLPLSDATKNLRSFVALDNLVDLVLTCVTHPRAVNQTFLVSDGSDLSTAGFILKLGEALKKPARLFYVPAGFIKFCAIFFGKKDITQSLLGNLQVDISHTCKTLGWKPPISMDEGLRRSVQGLNK